MKKWIVSCALTLGCCLQAMSPTDALNGLIQGNQRFINGQSDWPASQENLRKSQVDSQSPFAVVVACADSRVAPEIIFDQTIGELFVVRVAGNVVGPYEMESIEFAVDQLGSSCVIVLGHQNCGAVDAVVQGTTQDIPFIAKLIRPSVIQAKSENPSNLLERSIDLNALRMASKVKQSPIVNPLVQNGSVNVYAGYYDFTTGKVLLLKP